MIFTIEETDTFIRVLNTVDADDQYVIDIAFNEQKEEYRCLSDRVSFYQDGEPMENYGFGATPVLAVQDWIDSNMELIGADYESEVEAEREKPAQEQIA